MKSVWRYSFGMEEKVIPSKVHAGKIGQLCGGTLPYVADAPVCAEMISFKVTPRGCVLEIPMEEGEQFFGLGLQLKSVCQLNKKKTLRVNSDPPTDTGDSHAPVPFYVSTKGYAVLVDTARYASFYFGSHIKLWAGETNADMSGSAPAAVPATAADLYVPRTETAKRSVVVEIPAAKGVGIYIFGGPTMMDAVARYNLFSGGGVLPPMWGLGIWYRTYSYHNSDDMLKQADELRREHIPCDVYGFENASWQTHTYSCTYVWNKSSFPDPARTISQLNENHFHVNVWEHIFVHPDSPIYSGLKPYSGDYSVWGGIVPDFTFEQARTIFQNYHTENILDKGVEGYKLDECDNSDFIEYPWSYPETSEFPSGLDGEQMHSLMGLMYQEVMLKPFVNKNKRTYHGVRSSHAFASDMPYVLYSDLYNHRDYVRGMVTAGFSGLLWSPEVRDAESVDDLIRRIQTVIMSPMALLNIWYMNNPPWKQIETFKNRNGVFLENYKEVEDICREILRLRMSLVPYLYAEFYKYEKEGIPPFRSLALDFPDDAETYKIDDQYMIGGSLMFAPLFAGQTGRSVYLPAGCWYDFFTGKIFEGGKRFDIDCALDKMLLFVRSGTILPVAEPTEYISKDAPLQIKFVKYGCGTAETVLVDDDGESYDYRRGRINIITVRSDNDGNTTVCNDSDYRGDRYVFKAVLDKAYN